MAGFLIGCDGGPGGKAHLPNDEVKSMYSIGYDFGEKLKSLAPSKADLKAFKKGVMHGVHGKKAQVDTKKFLGRENMQKLTESRQKIVSDKEKKEAVKFLAAAEKTAGVEKTQSGLLFQETQAGTGATPTATDTVEVHYHGTLRDGTVFDSSKDRGQTAKFPLNRVVKCWTEGIQKMKVGGKATIWCPSEIAYGDRGAGGKIPPGAALKFDVELIGIVPQEGKDGEKKPGAMKKDAKAPAPKAKK